MKKLMIPAALILAVLIGGIWTAAETQEKNENSASEDEKNPQSRNQMTYWDPWAYSSFEEDPFLELERFHRHMQRWMHAHYRTLRQGPGGFSHGDFISQPRIDMEDLGGEIVIRCDLPGIEKDKIELSLTDNVIVIQGSRDMLKEDNKNSGGVRVYQSERSVGSFYRAIPLDVKVDSTKAAANYENGVLTIRLPKVTKDETKTIPIQIT